MQLNIYDMDGTVVDSTAAIRQCQIEGLQRATGKDLSELETILRERGLKDSLNHFNLDQDEFFHTYYKTFDPFEAVKRRKMNVFGDVLHSIKNSPYACLISNSEINATNRKLDAANLKGYFKHVFAELTKDKAKPQPYMANQLIDAIKEEGTLNSVDKLVNIGDMPVDVEFGLVAHEVLSTALGRNIPFKNYLLDRESRYETAPKGAELLKPRGVIYE